MSSLDSYRFLLHALARAQVSQRLAGKLDISGVVQQTLVEAHDQSGRWTDWEERQRVGWLQTALTNNLRDEVRRLHAQIRDVRREVRLEEPDSALDGVPLEVLEAEITSPGAAAVRSERLVRLAVALTTLPPDQQRAVELHHLGEMTLAQIAVEMNKSPQAVVGLLFRGMKALRTMLPEE